MLKSLPSYIWAVPTLVAAGAGFVWYRKRRAMRIDRRSSPYLKAIGKLDRPAPPVQEPMNVMLPEIWTPPPRQEERDLETSYRSSIAFPSDEPARVFTVEPMEEASPPPRLVETAPVYMLEEGPEPLPLPPLEPATPRKPALDAGAALKTLTAPLSRFKSKGRAETAESTLQSLTRTVTRNTTLPKIYERGLVMLYKPPGSLPRGAKPEFLLPWVVAQARASDVAPAFKDLSRREIRLVELAYEAIANGDRAFTALRAQVDATERGFLDTMRPMAKADARDTLEQLGSGMKSRVTRLLAATANNSAPPEPAPTEPARRAYLHASEMIHWLPATNDCDLWHILIGGLDFSEEAMLAVVKWIIEQPCDQATAALALIRIGAESEAGNDSIRGRFGYEAEVWTISKTICERFEAGQYASRDFNLVCVGQDNDQRPYLQKLLDATGESGLPWPDPTALFETPFDGRDAYSARFELIGDTLYHRSGQAAA